MMKIALGIFREESPENWQADRLKPAIKTTKSRDLIKADEIWQVVCLTYLYNFYLLESLTGIKCSLLDSTTMTSNILSSRAG